MKKTFGGIPEEYASSAKSKTVLIPVPYDGTSTWGKGADRGPDAFLEAAENMELYDIETDTEVYKTGIYLDDPITKLSSPEEMAGAVEKRVEKQITTGKLVTIIGGEHSVSIGAIRAMNRAHENLTVLQIDAHTDLRKEYGGTPYNHACALYEASQNTNLIQVGIRSMDALEKDVMNPEKVFFAHELVEDDYWMDTAIDQMTDNIYITFDLDALDPSILPATGTPEPGGLQWYETLDFLKQVFQHKNVVGFDIVELCPKGDYKPSAFAAAKLYYKMLSYQYAKDVNEDEVDDAFAKANTKNTPTKFKDEE
jgi:agmatinase